MNNFLINLIFPEKVLKEIKKRNKFKKDLNDPLKLTRPFFGNVDVLNYNFEKEIIEQDKSFQDITIFQKVTQTILSNQDSKEISKIIVDEIRKKLNYILGSLFIIDKEKGIGWPYIASTDVLPQLEFFYGKKISEHVGIIAKQDNLVVKCALTEKMYIGNDVRDFVSPVLSYRKAYLVQKTMKMKTFVVVPLKVKNKIFGALLVVSPREEIDSKEKILLKLLSDQVGIALYNAKLYEEIQNRVQALKEKTLDLKSLLDISEIAASSLDAQSVTRKIVDSIPEKFGHLGYLGGFLSMYNPKTTCVSAYSITESELVQKKVKVFLSKPFNKYCAFANKDKNLTIDAILTGKVKMDEDLDKFVCPPLSPMIVRKIQKLMGIKSNVVLPIFIRGQIIGSFMFYAKKPLKELGERDINLMKAFVDHVGISIDNAILFDKTNNQVKELEHAKAKLEQTLNMKAEFVHVVSHQLRTPLTVVRGLISMWYDGDFEKLPEGKRKDFRERIKSSIERLNSITNQMLRAMEFEGSITLNSEDVDLVKTVKDIIALLKPNFESKGLYLNFENKTGKNKLFIEADPNYISHVFNNIIDNAEKYTFKGGVVVTIGSRGKYVCVKIQDTGIGITKENKARLFKKFSRGVNALKDNPNGSGLGLFIAKQIVSEHKGKISFESEGLGKGTMFTVTLPVKKQD